MCSILYCLCCFCNLYPTKMKSNLVSFKTRCLLSLHNLHKVGQGQHFTPHRWQCAVFDINNCCGLTAPFSHDILHRDCFGWQNYEKCVTIWKLVLSLPIFSPAHFSFVCSASLLPIACPCLSNFEWWGPWGLVCPPNSISFSHLVDILLRLARLMWWYELIIKYYDSVITNAFLPWVGSWPWKRLWSCAFLAAW